MQSAAVVQRRKYLGVHRRTGRRRMVGGVMHGGRRGGAALLLHVRQHQAGGADLGLAVGELPVQRMAIGLGPHMGRVFRVLVGGQRRVGGLPIPHGDVFVEAGSAAEPAGCLEIDRQRRLVGQVLQRGHHVGLELLQQIRAQAGLALAAEHATDLAHQAARGLHAVAQHQHRAPAILDLLRLAAERFAPQIPIVDELEHVGGQRVRRPVAVHLRDPTAHKGLCRSTAPFSSHGIPPG